MYNVLDYLKESARKYPDKVAFADIDQSITYEELYRKAQEIGSALASKISIGQPVPIFMEKSVDTICLFFGVVYAGGFYVLLDMKQPQTKIKSYYEDVRFKNDSDISKIYRGTQKETNGK